MALLKADLQSSGISVSLIDSRELGAKASLVNTAAFDNFMVAFAKAWVKIDSSDGKGEGEGEDESVGGARDGARTRSIL